MSRFLFVGGLHRSGTTPLYRLLATDNNISCFSNTGVIEDEGQFLQTVYPVDSVFGGVLFGLNPLSNLTENTRLLSEGKNKLFKEWSRFWDLDKPVLAEKSPANLIRARFLREIFPESAFIFVLRHPVATCMAVSKWTEADASTLIKHWITCHEIMRKDIENLDRVEIIKYEDYVSDGNVVCNAAERLLGFPPCLDFQDLKRGLNQRYFKLWRRGNFHLPDPRWRDLPTKVRNLLEIRDIEKNFESRINEFGYSFNEVYKYS